MTVSDVAAATAVAIITSGPVTSAIMYSVASSVSYSATKYVCKKAVNAIVPYFFRSAPVMKKVDK